VDETVGGGVRNTKMKCISRSYLDLAELPSSPLDRISRYEAALWRQFAQTLFASVEAKRGHLIASSHRFRVCPETSCWITEFSEHEAD
jgi:hypothetical protein